MKISPRWPPPQNGGLRIFSHLLQCGSNERAWVKYYNIIKIAAGTKWRIVVVGFSFSFLYTLFNAINHSRTWKSRSGSWSTCSPSTLRRASKTTALTRGCRRLRPTACCGPTSRQLSPPRTTRTRPTSDRSPPTSSPPATRAPRPSTETPSTQYRP